MRIYKYKYSLWGLLSALALAIMAGLNASSFKDWILVTFFLILALISLTYKTGLEFTKDSKYRKFSSILGKTFGKWDRISGIQYLSVVRVKQAKYRVSSGFVDQEKSNKIIYQVNAIYDTKKHKRLLSADKSNAIKFAVEIARYLNLEILDFTTPGHKGFISTDKN